MLVLHRLHHPVPICNAHTMKHRPVLLSTLLNYYRMHPLPLPLPNPEPQHLLRQQTPILRLIAPQHPPLTLQHAVLQQKLRSLVGSTESRLGGAGGRCDRDPVDFDCEGGGEGVHCGEGDGSEESRYDGVGEVHWVGCGQYG